ncbi:hypothetical protein BDZ85DRAFT_308435 [Elsinoe ampelina]|uniref:Uncharacterized protein n=1 Tax=Elsinoe ampelina TaxID=302913 RepID=A0A6A6FYZ5_9PEZI|nr:hypothetical protein BDZ85DRAFT_308435 [Elsinoe ampelina]
MDIEQKMAECLALQPGIERRHLTTRNQGPITYAVISFTKLDDSEDVSNDLIVRIQAANERIRRMDRFSSTVPQRGSIYCGQSPDDPALATFIILWKRAWATFEIQAGAERQALTLETFDKMLEGLNARTVEVTDWLYWPMSYFQTTERTRVEILKLDIPTTSFDNNREVLQDSFQTLNAFESTITPPNALGLLAHRDLEKIGYAW